MREEGAQFERRQERVVILIIFSSFHTKGRRIKSSFPEFPFRMQHKSLHIGG
jgi:hypothetical protein